MSAPAPAEVRLDCPLCEAVVWDAPGEPSRARCPGCGAHVLGGADDPRSAVVAAATELGLDVDLEALALGLFAIGPGHPLEGSVAITSDRRATFYRWWVVVAGEEPALVLARAAV